MSNTFQSGLLAAQAGMSHMDNPFELASEAYDMWAKGWLVGDAPEVWSHLAPKAESMVDTALVEVLTCQYVADPMETEWEAGRKASQNGGDLADNPYDPETVSGEEWARGFSHGVPAGESRSANEADGDYGLPLPGVQTLPHRSFWAVLNNLQLKRQYSVGELAAFIGLSADRIKNEMTLHGFYDSDGIPLFEEAAA